MPNLLPSSFACAPLPAPDIPKMTILYKVFHLGLLSVGFHPEFLKLSEDNAYLLLQPGPLGSNLPDEFRMGLVPILYIQLIPVPPEIHKAAVQAECGFLLSN